MKKNVVLISWFILLSFTSFCQDTIYKVSLNDTTVYSLLERRTIFITVLSDSLNNYTRGRLPLFLLLNDLDYIYANLWDGNHQPICLRKMIFEKVNNRKVLKAIIKSKNKNYQRISERRLHVFGSLKIQYQDVSNMDFAKERIKELRNK